MEIPRRLAVSALAGVLVLTLSCCAQPRSVSDSIVYGEGVVLENHYLCSTPDCESYDPTPFRQTVSAWGKHFEFGTEKSKIEDIEQVENHVFIFTRNNYSRFVYKLCPDGNLEPICDLHLDDYFSLRSKSVEVSGDSITVVYTHGYPDVGDGQKTVTKYLSHGGVFDYCDD